MAYIFVEWNCDKRNSGMLYRDNVLLDIAGYQTPGHRSLTLVHPNAQSHWYKPKDLLNKMCLWNTMPPIMANSNEGQDHKDKYFDTSRKILSQEITMYNKKL